MPLIWTDASGRVRRIHHQPDTLSDEQAVGGILVDYIPEPDQTDPWVSTTLHYDETDETFRYEYEDEFDQLQASFTREEKKQIYDVTRSGSLEDVVNLIQ